MPGVIFPLIEDMETDLFRTEKTKGPLVSDINPIEFQSQNTTYFNHIMGPLIDYKTKLAFLESRAKLSTLDTLKQLRSRVSFAGLFMHLEQTQAKSYEAGILKDEVKALRASNLKLQEELKNLKLKVK